MMEVRTGQIENSVVVHFGANSHTISVYTLATTLVGIADATRAANAELNPGHDIQVVVEALDSGSFKATIRTLYTSAHNLFSGESARAVTLSVVASFIYQHTLAPNAKIEVQTGPDEVVIVQGDTRVVVPREVHDALRKLENNQPFTDGVSKAMTALDNDPRISSLAFSTGKEPPAELLKIPRERFATLAQQLLEPESDERVIEEVHELQIIRAILERSKRRWEFVWNGVRIPAPVTDEKFYSDFCDRRIAVAPGDVFKAKLRIRQRKNAALGVFLNQSYEVVEVLEHTHIDPLAQLRINTGPSTN